MIFQPSHYAPDLHLVHLFIHVFTQPTLSISNIPSPTKSGAEVAKWTRMFSVVHCSGKGQPGVMRPPRKQLFALLCSWNRRSQISWPLNPLPANKWYSYHNALLVSILLNHFLLLCILDIHIYIYIYLTSHFSVPHLVSSENGTCIYFSLLDYHMENIEKSAALENYSTKKSYSLRHCTY